MLAPQRPAPDLGGRWQARLTVVVGAGGSGKTVALSAAVTENLRSVSGLDVWFSCQAADRDQDQFAVGLLDALLARLGADGLAPLDREGTRAFRRIRDTVWAQAPLRVCLVLDDIDRLGTGPRAIAPIRRLLGILPANAQVVVATRRIEVGNALVAAAEGEINLVEVPGAIACEELGASLGGRPREAATVVQLLGTVGPLDDSEIGQVLGPDVEAAVLLDGLPGVSRSGDRYLVHEAWRRALPDPTTEQVRNWQRAVMDVVAAGPDVERAFAVAVRAESWPDVLEAVAGAVLEATYAGATPQVAQRLSELPTGHLGPGAAMLAEAMLASNAGGEADRSRLVRAAELLADEGHPQLQAAALARLLVQAWWAGDVDRIEWCRRCGGEADHPIATWVGAVAEVLAAELDGDEERLLAARVAIRFHTAPEPLRSILMVHYSQHQLDRGPLGLALDVARHGIGKVRVELEPDLGSVIAWAEWHRGDRVAARSRLATLADHGANQAGYALARADLDLVDTWTRPATGPEPDELLRQAEAAAAGGLAEAALVRSVTAAVRLVADGDERQAAEVVAGALASRPAGARARTALVRAAGVIAILAPEESARLSDGPQGEAVAAATAAGRAVLDARAGNLAAAPAVDLDLLPSLLPPTWAAELVLRLADTGVVAESEADQVLEQLGAAGAEALALLAAGTDARLAELARSAQNRTEVGPPGEFLLRLLGPGTIELDGRRVEHPDWRRERVRALLALLVQRREVTRPEAAELLWPDLDPGASGNNLRVTLSYLQRVLEPDRDRTVEPFHVRADAHKIRFTGSARWSLDAAEFERHLDRARAHERRGEVQEAMDALTSATDLYRGAWLADIRLGYADEMERDRLRSRFVGAAARLGELLLADGQLPEAQQLAARAQAVDPYSEAAAALAISCYLDAGDRAAAVREYRRIADLLAELDLEPSEQVELAAAPVLATSRTPGVQ